MAEFCIDNREPDEIKKKYVDVAKYENLAVGDYMFRVNGVVVKILERKSLADLAASIKDGRYKEQKAELLSKFDVGKISYIIEGDFKYSYDCDQVSLNGMSMNCLVGVVINTMMRDGINIMFTNNIDETISFLDACWRRLKDDPMKYVGGSNVEHVNVVRLKGSFFENMLCQVPGVSMKTAKGIATKYNMGANDSLIKFYDIFKNRNKNEILGEMKSIVIDKRRISNVVAQRIVDSLF